MKVKHSNIKLCLIGSGAWGKNYLKTAYNIKTISVTDLTKQIKLYYKEKTLVKFFKNFSKSEFDGMIISVHPDIQAELIIQAIKFKIPLLIEKPICLNFEDLQNICRLKSNQQIILVNHYHLFMNSINFIKEKINPLDINNICIYDGDCGPFRKNFPCLFDWGPHSLGLVNYIFEEKPIKIFQLKKEIKQNNSEIWKLKLTFSKNRKSVLKFGNGFNSRIKVIKIYLKTDSKPIIIQDNLLKCIPSKFNYVKNNNFENDPMENILNDFADCISNNILDKKNSFKVASESNEILFGIYKN